MIVSEVMAKPWETVSVNAVLEEASEQLDSAGMGQLPVCDGDERFVGVVSGLDLVARKTTDGASPSPARVGEVMSRPMHYVFEDQDVIEAARVLEQTHVHRISVLDRQWHVVGTMSQEEVAAADVVADSPEAG